MNKPSNYLWIGALVVGLAGCSGSSSSDESGSGPLFPINDDGPVTLPDGTVIDRPNVEDIHPDAVPIEMEHEYEYYVWETSHLRDPRGNVYEVISLDEQGTEVRSYLVLTDEINHNWGYGYAYVFWDQGECYARPTSAVPNTPLYGGRVTYNEQDEANSGAGAYRLTMDLLDTDWEVSWQLGEYGLIDRIVLLDDEGEIIASASREDDEYLEHRWVDRGEEVSVRLPFEPVGRPYYEGELYAATFLGDTCDVAPFDLDFIYSRFGHAKYEIAGEHDVVHFYFSPLDFGFEDLEYPRGVTQMELQMFTENPELPCVDLGERALVYFNSYRFEGPYVEWYEVLDGDDSKSLIREGLTFDEDGYLIESSSGLLTPTSTTDLDMWDVLWDKCSDYELD